MNPADVQRAWERFGFAVQRLFRSWTALQIAVEQGFGGVRSAEKAKNLEYDVFDFFRAKQGKVDHDMLEELLDDKLDEQFNLLLEDGSVGEISGKLIMFCSLLQKNDSANFDRELARLPGAANTSACVAAPEAEDVMMDDSEMLSEYLEDMNLQPGESQMETSGRNFQSENSISINEESSISIDEEPSSQTDSGPRRTRNEPDADGWTTVAGNGRRKTKP